MTDRLWRALDYAIGYLFGAYIGDSRARFRGATRGTRHAALIARRFGR